MKSVPGWQTKHGVLAFPLSHLTFFMRKLKMQRRRLRTDIRTLHSFIRNLRIKNPMRQAEHFRSI